jgi:hypothetical protein
MSSHLQSKNLTIKICKTIILPIVLYGCLKTGGFDEYLVLRGRGWRKLHSEELHNLYSSPYIVRMIISRRMRWAGHVVCMGEIGNAYKIWLESLKGRDHSENLDIK